MTAFICYLFLKVDEAVALINEEELKSTAMQVVASEVNFPQLGKFPLEVLCLASVSAWRVVKEVDVTGRDFQLTSDYLHHCDQLTFLSQYQLLFAHQLFCN